MNINNKIVLCNNKTTIEINNKIDLHNILIIIEINYKIYLFYEKIIKQY